MYQLCAVVERFEPFVLRLKHLKGHCNKDFAVYVGQNCTDIILRISSVSYMKLLLEHNQFLAIFPRYIGETLANCFKLQAISILPIDSQRQMKPDSVY